jgi:TonB family protein
MDLDTEDQGKLLFCREVGKLEARDSRSFGVRLPLAFGLGEGKYQMHFYVNGREVFNSMMPMETMDNEIHRMVWKRIEGVKDAELQVFICPMPEIPKAFKKARATGSVTVSFRVIANGSVLDPKVVASTHPELIEPTLAAVRLWYFLPRVKNGRPVEAKVQLPINFSPPAK